MEQSGGIICLNGFESESIRMRCIICSEWFDYDFFFIPKFPICPECDDFDGDRRLGWPDPNIFM